MESFIIQTAQDYAMEVHEVQRIYELYPDNFYEKLEEYIKNRGAIKC